MKVSIVTPVLNRAGTIRACVESVVQQQDDAGALQHIVVDGGSDDGTLEILADYPHLDVIHEPRRGIYVAMNRGLAAARHDTVGIVNSDDLLAPGALAHVGRCFADNPQAQVVAGCAQVEREGPDGRAPVRRVPRRGHQSQNWDLLFHGSTAINARFFRRALLAELGDFDTAFPLAADRDLLIRWKLAGVATLPSDRILYRYLEHEGSATLNAAARHDAQMRREHIAIAEKYLGGQRLTPSQQRQFRGWIAAERARAALALLQAGDSPAAWRQAKEGLSASLLSFATFFLRRILAGLRMPARR